MKRLLERFTPSPALLRAIGWALALASLLFIVRAALAADFGSLLARLDPWSGMGLAGLALIYGGLMGLLAVAWRFGFPPSAGEVQVRPAIVVYGASIFPKYIPGSVFQYASRQGLGASFGWSQRDMAFATVLELVLHVVAASIVFLIADLVLGLGYADTLFAVPLAAVFCAGGIWLHRRRRDWFGPLAISFLLQLLFFAGLMFVAGACAALVAPAGAIAAGPLFLLGWLIAFVTPGLPGGIGVREAALLWLTAPVLGPGPALLFSGATRVVTLCGDLVFGCGALLLQRAAKRSGAG